MGKYLIIAVALFGVADVISNEPWKDLSQLGAVGVLAWVAWSQRRELISLREDMKISFFNIMDRHHKDSNTLNQTLTQLQIHCAEIHAKTLKDT